MASPTSAAPTPRQTILEAGQKKADGIEKAYRQGAITAQERYANLIELWGHARKQVTDDLMETLANDYRDETGRPVAPKTAGTLKYLNPINMMATSKARGSGRPDAAAGRDAGSDGQAVGRNHRNANQGQLP